MIVHYETLLLPTVARPLPSFFTFQPAFCHPLALTSILETLYF